MLAPAEAGTYTVTCLTSGGCFEDITVVIAELNETEPDPAPNQGGGITPLDLSSSINVFYDNGSNILISRTGPGPGLGGGTSPAYVPGGTFKVFSLTGVLIKTGPFEECTMMLDTSDLDKGIYLIQCGNNVARFMAR